MGARLYCHTTAYLNDPASALEAIQSEILAGYNLRELVTTHLQSSQQAFDDTPPNDEFGLHDYYKAEFARAEDIAAAEIPTEFSGRIHLVRRLFANTGEGIGSILDVDGIAGGKSAAISAARRLEPDDVVAKFSTSKPVSSNADDYAAVVNESLGRGECVFFPLYGDVDDEEPGEWCFVGNTVD